jgi:small conductance mechanosensitive channel
MSNPTSLTPLLGPDFDVNTRVSGRFIGHESSTGMRILIIVVTAVLAHGLARALRHVSEWLIVRRHGQPGRLGLPATRPKLDTVTRLLVSSAAFIIYFVAVGLILQEFGFSLAAYLASASVLGLAISFGCQGLVQDIVIGLTLIFWDALDVNDMVEVVGTVTTVIGRVEEIGMRFTKVVNFYNQKVFIPNRTIGNVSRFPHGGVDAYADPQIPTTADPAQVVQLVADVAVGMWTQFGAIILAEPILGEVTTAQGGSWRFVRVHFKIWPGQGSLIEATFRQEVIKLMRSFDPKYSDWQVPVTYRAGITSRNLKAHPPEPKP